MNSKRMEDLNQAIDDALTQLYGSSKLGGFRIVHKGELFFVTRAEIASYMDAHDMPSAWGLNDIGGVACEIIRDTATSTGNRFYYPDPDDKGMVRWIQVRRKGGTDRRPYTYFPYSCWSDGKWHRMEPSFESPVATARATR